MDHLKVANKRIQRMESEVCGKQNYKDDQSFSYKLFGTVKLSGTALRVPSNNGATPIQIPAST
jgi:hypothetical protein